MSEPNPSRPHTEPAQIEPVDKTDGEKLAPAEEEQKSSPSGLNLTLVYAILFVVLLVAFAMAVLIVLPFYRRSVP